MKDGAIYFDNAATTKVSESVIKVVNETLKQTWGNPSSLYKKGYEAHKLLEQSRKTVAGALGCLPDEVVFTASGTEANNIALLGAARARKNFGSEVVITGYEHPSVYETAKSLEDEGFFVIVVNPGIDGAIDIGELLSKINKKTALVAAMQVNNETGATLDAAALAKRIKNINARTAVHCDCVQGFLKYPIKLSSTTIDTAAVSGHKLHAPKGIGALYVRKGFNIKPVVHGGGQENGLRSGTENVAYAAAFAEAVRQFDTAKNRENVETLNGRLRRKLSMVEGVEINSPNDASVYILNFSVLGFRSETMLHWLDDNGILLSSGSACSKGNTSRTLLSMGLDSARIDSSLRVSFSDENTGADVDKLVNLIVDLKKTLIQSRG